MNQLRIGAIISYLTIVLNILIGLAYTPFLIKMLGQSEYGLYSLATSVIGYLTVLDLGFGNAIIRYTAKFRAENKVKEQYEMFGMFIRLYVFIGFIAFIAGLMLLFNIDAMFGDTMTGDELSRMRVLMMLMAFNLAFTFPLSIFGSIISAYENFVFQKIITLVRIFLNPLVMVILLFFGYKSITLVVITTIFNMSTLLINYWYCKKKLNIKIYYAKFDISLLKEISIYSFWIFLNAIMDRIYWSTGQFILGIYRGTAIVAIYAVAIQLKTMFFMFSTAISSVILPKITMMISNRATDKDISDFFIKTGRIQYLIMAYILSSFIIFGQIFINVWIGPEYNESYLITVLLFVPSLIPLIQNTGIAILQAHNKLKFRSLLYISISVSSVFLAIPLAKTYGGIGCAIATSLALVLGQGFIMNIYYAKKINLDIVLFWRQIILMSIAPLLLSLIFYFGVNYYKSNTFSYLIASGLLFTLFYIPLIWKFSMNQYEKGVVRSIAKKIMKFKK